MNVITRILTTPEAVKELTAAPVKKGIDWERIIGIYLTVSLVVSHILLFAMLWNIAHYAKKDAYERYKRLAGFRRLSLSRQVFRSHSSCFSFTEGSDDG